MLYHVFVEIHFALSPSISPGGAAKPLMVADRRQAAFAND